MLGVPLALAAGFALAAWVGSTIPANAQGPAPRDGITILVETNDVHTGIVVPVLSEVHDWRRTFPSASQPRPDGRLPTHLAIGWGEREVFLNVPTWSDLEISTALRIAVMGGEPLMRVAHYVRPRSGPNHRPVTLSRAQYARLVRAIEAALPTPSPGARREVLRGTYSADAYYEAIGDYTLVTTCNSWVGDVLAEAGVPMGLWTPFAGGVTKWVPIPENR